MTSINLVINLVDYGAFTVEADIWRDTQTGIGRWQAIIDPAGNYWPGVFNVDDTVFISINGVLMMAGYVDDVKPYLDTKGYHTDLFLLTGRDLGMDLAQLFYKPSLMGGLFYRQDFINTQSGTIIATVINNMRAYFGGPIPEINPPGAVGGLINYNWMPRMMLGDGIKEIALLDNYDFYVDDTTTNLMYFPVGTVASGVTLIDFAASTLNNILEIEVGESLGLDLKNYVEVVAGSLNDHWTELNGTDNAATGWNSGNATCTVGDNIIFVGPFGPANEEVLNNRGAIYCERSVPPAGNNLEMYLDFGLLATGYNQNGFINLEDSSYLRYLVVQNATDIGGVGNQVCPVLTDNLGNQIAYLKTTAFPAVAPNKQSFNGGLTNNNWYEVTCHIGYDTRIGGILPPDYWVFIAGGAPFNWNQVTRITFSTLMNSPIFSWFVIDGLQIPTVDVSALAQNVVLPSPGYRMKVIDRRDIISQLELQAYADDYLDKHVDPLETLRCTCSGQTGTPYAGETVEVVAPNLGVGGPLIGNTVEYRILKLHHQVFRNSRESPQAGYNFLTTYDLAKNEVGGVKQPVDVVRYWTSVDPSIAHAEFNRHNRIWRMIQKIRTSYSRGT